jgi:hypothetical protein
VMIGQKGPSSGESDQSRHRNKNHEYHPRRTPGDRKFI